MVDEDFGLDGDAGADERMALDAAPRTDRDIALDFNETADHAIVADAAAVKVDKRIKPDAFAEHDVGGEAIARRIRHRGHTKATLVARP
ncbi:MAG: hypothetical protein PHQ04_07760 [Opitutaceae bacterium]|nr:hypothetical protein [Opitutaceae bacterium]